MRPPCERCNTFGAVTGARAMNNSAWCRGCWQRWWKSVELHSYLQQRAAQRKPTNYEKGKDK